jgi:multicomponent Na+:H+ antiporter subunit G
MAREALVVALLLAGLFFHAVASVGMLRLPDFYTRLHALSKADTLGTLLALGALVLWEGPTLTTVKILFIAAFFFLSNPVAAHAVARAALRSGLAPRAAPEDPPAP